jgi:hypothetical protein
VTIAVADSINPLYQEMPFSRPFDLGDVTKISTDLLQLFEISGVTKVISCSSQQALLWERFFRLRWWLQKDDELKHAMHNLGRQLDIKSSNNPEMKMLLSQAWHQAESLTASEAWRSEIRIRSGVDDLAKLYFQVYFRFLQQCVNRAVRWEALFKDVPTPYSFLYSLTLYGVFPLGFYENTFHCIKLSPSLGADTIEPQNVIYGSDLLVKYRNRKRVFISYEFNRSQDLDQLIKRLHFDSIETDLGPVADNIIPIEHQLADRLSACSALLVILESVDEDFGLPIWIFQECDLASTLAIPIVIAINAPEGLSIFNGKATICNYDKENLNLIVESILKLLE